MSAEPRARLRDASAGQDRKGRPRVRPATAAVSGELIDRLNTFWRITGPPAGRASFKQRLAAPFRRALARFFGPQETFNAAVVQYVNTVSSSQQVMLDQILDVAMDQVDGAIDQVQRQREALEARERRMEAAMAALRSEQAELRTTISILQNDVRSHRSKTPDSNATSKAAGSNASNDTNVSNVLSSKYVGFEDQFRGSQEAIRERLAGYVPIFAGASDVLDVGCGRGEFLKLLREQGIGARGIDVNEAMVDVCREQGLDATSGDALAYLRGLPDESLGGLFAAQVVEHLEPGYLTHLLEEAAYKLRPGAAIVLETINPACWFAFFESYIRDITHVRPLHPDTLRFLLVASGFRQVEIQYHAPYPEHEKLQKVAARAGFEDAFETLNGNAEKLNQMLFTYLDYAAIARRS